MQRYSATVCKRGHYRNKFFDDGTWPGTILEETETEEPYCSECGAPVIAACPKCNARIFGAHVGVASAGLKPQNFCHACGAPYPWADRASLVMQLRNVLEFEPGLDDAKRLEVAEQITALSESDADDKRRERAGRVLGKLAPKGWQAAEPVLQTLLSAELRKQLGLP